MEEACQVRLAYTEEDGDGDPCPVGIGFITTDSHDVVISKLYIPACCRC